MTHDATLEMLPLFYLESFHISVDIFSILKLFALFISEFHSPSFEEVKSHKMDSLGALSATVTDASLLHPPERTTEAVVLRKIWENTICIDGNILYIDNEI